MTEGFCYQCHHVWNAHDDGTDGGDYCRVCECDGYVPGFSGELLWIDDVRETP